MLSSLRVRLTFTFLVLALVPMVIVAFIVAQRSIDILTEQNIVSQQLIAQRVETDINAHLQESENELRFLIDVLGIASMSEQEQRTLLQNTFSQRSTYNSLSLLDAFGQERVRISRLETILTLHDRSDQPEYTQVIEDNALYYSPIYFSESLREPLITLSMPIENLITGNIAYVLVAELRFKAIWDLIAQTNTDEFSTVYVTDTSGKVVAHRNPSIVLSNTSSNIPETDGVTRGLTGSEVILASRTLTFGDQELHVVAEQDLDDAFRNVRATRNLAFSITGLALLVVAIFTYYSVDGVVRPIEILSKTASRIQQGDLTLRVSQTRTDELGDLAISFNRMTDRLNGLIGHLEERVKTRTHELEEARQQAESASNAKSTFLSNMSHELRTPLNMVIGYTSSMLNMPQMYGGKFLSEEFRDDVQLIQDNGRYLLGLINDILDLSKIEVGKLEIHPSAINLNDIFQGVIATSIGLLKDKQIQIRPDYRDHLPLVWADPLRLRQILLNLMSNAVKFTETGTVTLSAVERDDKITIAVIDTGVGIPEEALSVIFDRFEQIQSNMSIQGTGLGLDISQHLAQMHGSEVTIESQIDQGSTFKFDILIATAEQIERSGDGREQPDYSSVKVFNRDPSISLDNISILLGSDHSEDRATQRQWLEAADCIVIETNKAEQIQEFATGLMPDLILIDADTFANPIDHILKPLRDDPLTENMPVLWLTRVANHSVDEHRTRKVLKPIESNELIIIVRQLMSPIVESD